jgi:2-desacetyl-2-hydroxyethyl bacteriochlorophyllide A dehydrogenase
VIGRPDDLRIIEMTIDGPGPGELLITPDAVGVCGTDLELLAGTMGYLVAGAARYPITPGHEWTGLVLETGAGVAGFERGDRVVGECSVGCGSCAACAGGRYHLCPDRTETGIINRVGGLTTRFCFPAGNAHRVSPDVDRLDAALIEPLAVALRGLRRLGVDAIESLGIVGAGNIGLLCAMVGRAAGADPVLVERSDARRQFAEGLGYSVRAIADREFSYVIDATGTPSGIAAAVRATADGGSLAALGLCGQPEVPLDVDTLVLRDLTLLGSLGSPGVWPDAIELVESGRVLPSAIVSHQVGLDESAGAFELFGRRDPEVRKVVIDPQRTATG